MASPAVRFAIHIDDIEGIKLSCHESVLATAFSSSLAGFTQLHVYMNKCPLKAFKGKEYQNNEPKKQNIMDARTKSKFNLYTMQKDNTFIY